MANLIFARAWLFHLAQWAGGSGLKLFTRKDGWIHSLPSVGAKWTQTRDLRGLPKQTFHRLVGGTEDGKEGGADERRGRSPQAGFSERIRAATRGPRRISAATAAEAYAAIPRDYVRRGDMTVSARHERFD